MYNHTTIVVKKILEVYKGFEPTIKQLVDVGGGLGVNLNLITSTYPHIKGINFDLPHVIKHAPSYPGMYVYVIYGLLALSCFNSEFQSLAVVNVVLNNTLSYMYVCCRCGTCRRRYVCECSKR